MLLLLAVRNLIYRPWRSLLLLFGYGVGVAVMIVLLAIGEALLTQARDERLVGGGAITVLPEGVDIEVLKTGGLGGLFFSIDHSRFIYRQMLASARLSDAVGAVAPQIVSKLLYIRTRSGQSIPVRALGEIPEATRTIGAAPVLAMGRWSNDAGDRRYVTPMPAELIHELDHFHLPPERGEHRDSWAEWHYFNIVSRDTQHWAFLSFMVNGDVLGAMWGGRVAITLVDQHGRPRRYVSIIPASSVRLSTTDANLTLGSSTVTVLADGRYAVHGSAVEEGEAGHTAPGMVTVDLIVTPSPNAYFPGASLGSATLVSGYVVPALRAQVTGSICESRHEGRYCERYVAAQGYHDHNWGIWHGVTWDWGASRAGAYTILYGRVIPSDSVANAPSVLVYLIDSLGFLAVFRPQRIAYTDARTILVGGVSDRVSVHVPSQAVFADAHGGDTLRVTLDIEDAIGTDHRRSLVEHDDRSNRNAAEMVAHPYFIQMKGKATISGRVGGRAIGGTGTGFFETYR